MNNSDNKKSGDLEGGAWWQPSLILFAKMSFWIAVPIVTALFIGRFLDSYYNTEPWLFLFSIGFSFFISIFGLVKEVSKEFKKINDEANGLKPLKQIDVEENKINK